MHGALWEVAAILEDGTKQPLYRKHAWQIILFPKGDLEKHKWTEGTQGAESKAHGGKSPRRPRPGHV